MFTRIHNVVIAVKNLDEASGLWQKNFGLKPARSGELPNLGIKNVIYQVGNGTVELMEPLNAEQGPVAKFLQTKGEGLYMIELEVDDVDKAVKEMQAKGVRLIGADPESRAKGGLVFIHPQATKGVLIQLVPKGHH